MILARAPMRITLGGGGTDLPAYYSRYGGFTLGAAINKYQYIYVNRPRTDGLIRVKCSQNEKVAAPDEVQHDLVRPALKLLGLRRNVEIVSMADVSPGAGLGSAGTFLVGLLTALFELKRKRVPPQALAEFACKVEIGMAQHSVGKQDHYLAAFGGITSVEIEPDGRVQVRPVNISRTTAQALRHRLLLFYTGRNGGAGARLPAPERDAGNGNAHRVESLHRSKEMGYRVREYLENGELDKFGHLLHEDWQRREPSAIDPGNVQIEQWYTLAREAGALGGRQLGNGGGGFLMFYAPGRKQGAVRRALAAAGLKEMPYNFDFEGAKVLVNS